MRCPAYSQDDAVTEITEEICGEINAETGEFEPCDGAIERTYSMPDISVGFVLDIRVLKIEPIFCIEVLEKWAVKFDIGVGSGIAFGSLGYKITSIVEIAPIVFGGIRVPEMVPTYGAGIIITKF